MKCCLEEITWRPRYRWENNIQLHVKLIACEGVDWICLPTTGSNNRRSADEIRGVGKKPVQITGTQFSGRGPGTQLCCICMSLSRKHHYLSIVQINPFRPGQNHLAPDNKGRAYFFSFTSNKYRVNFLAAPPRSQWPSTGCREHD